MSSSSCSIGTEHHGLEGTQQKNHIFSDIFDSIHKRCHNRRPAVVINTYSAIIPNGQTNDIWQTIGNRQTMRINQIAANKVQYQFARYLSTHTQAYFCIPIGLDNRSIYNVYVYWFIFSTLTINELIEQRKRKSACPWELFERRGDNNYVIFIPKLIKLKDVLRS